MTVLTVRLPPRGVAQRSAVHAVSLTGTLMWMLPLDVEGPVTIEVFTVARVGESLMLTGPCGPAPWLIETGDGENPLDIAVRIIKGALRESILVHSTSWRFERGAVVLSFLAVVPEVGEMDAKPVERSALARNEEHSAPDDISFGQVLEHALRHLAWLAEDDEVVHSALDAEWLALLGGYVPEPFRQLD